MSQTLFCVGAGARHAPLLRSSASPPFFCPVLVATMPGPVYSFLASLPLPTPPAALTKWTPGESPLSTHGEVVGALAVYLAIIFGGQYLMADRKPFRESRGVR